MTDKQPLYYYADVEEEKQRITTSSILYRIIKSIIKYSKHKVIANNLLWTSPKWNDKQLTQRLSNYANTTMGRAEV